MHTVQDEGTGATAHFNSDFSGAIVLSWPVTGGRLEVVVPSEVFFASARLLLGRKVEEVFERHIQAALDEIWESRPAPQTAPGTPAPSFDVCGCDESNEYRKFIARVMEELGGSGPMKRTIESLQAEAERLFNLRR